MTNPLEPFTLGPQKCNPEGGIFPSNRALLVGLLPVGASVGAILLITGSLLAILVLSLALAQKKTKRDKLGAAWFFVLICTLPIVAVFALVLFVRHNRRCNTTSGTRKSLLVLWLSVLVICGVLVVTMILAMILDAAYEKYMK